MRALRLWPLLIVAVYLLVCVYGLQQYLQWSSVGFILGLLALQVGTSFNRYAKGSYRFFIAAVLFLFLFLLIPAKTFLYLSLAASVLFFAEAFYGRINLLPQLVLLLMSPWAESVANLFSFPIRLKLSAWAGQLLRLSDTGVTVHGNMISYNSHEFIVDPACMGLKMMITSLLCGLILIGFYQKKTEKALKGWKVMILLAAVVLLNILSNLIRIVCLVKFNIQPENPMHEMMGVICLAAYVILPLLFLNRWTVQRYGMPVKHVRGAYEIRSASKMFVCNLSLAAGLLIVMFHAPTVVKNETELPAVAGFHAEPLPNDVVKLENKDVLIYIKHIPGYYYTEHHPMICWKGSGFEFREVQEKMLNGNKVYTALLQQGDAVLYTAWWYENGRKLTNSQLDWRWDVFSGAHNYSLVNVTAATQEQLEKQIDVISTLHPYKALL